MHAFMSSNPPCFRLYRLETGLIDGTHASSRLCASTAAAPQRIMYADVARRAIVWRPFMVECTNRNMRMSCVKQSRPVCGQQQSVAQAMTSTAWKQRAYWPLLRDRILCASMGFSWIFGELAIAYVGLYISHHHLQTGHRNPDHRRLQLYRRSRRPKCRSR